jgi:hypothetical protein
MVHRSIYHTASEGGQFSALFYIYVYPSVQREYLLCVTVTYSSVSANEYLKETRLLH